MSLQTAAAVATWSSSPAEQAASRSATRGSAAVDAKVKSANDARKKATAAAAKRAATAKANAKKRAALAAIGAKTTAKTYVEQPAPAQPAAPSRGASTGSTGTTASQGGGARLATSAPATTRQSTTRQSTTRQSTTRSYASTSAPTSAPATTGAWTCPIAGCGGIFTSGFGYRVSPGGIGSTNHKGIDLSAPTGTPLRALGNATVAYVGWYGGQGMRVLLDFGNGVQASYAHMSGFAVAQGQRVSAGQVIGFVGSTGNSTGPHLHLEILIGGGQINPVPWLSARGLL